MSVSTSAITRMRETDTVSTALKATVVQAPLRHMTVPETPLPHAPLLDAPRVDAPGLNVPMHFYRVSATELADDFTPQLTHAFKPVVILRCFELNILGNLRMGQD